MKVLVTGSDGFIGRYLVKYLTEKNFTVYPYDILRGQDLFDRKTLIKNVSKVESIIHLAAVGDIYQAAKNPAKALEIGIVGTQNLIDVANEYKIKKIIYISTWEVYGKTISQSVDEMHPCNPDHPYTIAKYGGELVIRSTFNRIPWIILRLGTVYGKNMRKSTVISSFIEKSIANTPLDIKGNGSQFRQFTNINDVASAIYISLLSKIKNEVINIVDDKKITILELASLIKKITDNNKLKIHIGKPRPGEVFSSYVNNKKAHMLIKWSPKGNLEKTIRKIASNR